MTDSFRDCPDCGTMRPFAQRHPDAQDCPDAADGLCPEWFCTDCGTGLLIGLLPASLDLAAARASRAGRADRTSGQLDRVA